PVQRPLETGFDIIQNGNTIQLVNNAKNYYAFTWDFGDGTTSSVPNTSYEYKTKGEYIITQRIAHNCKQNSLQRKIIIN
nr:PKD domain-containing protein [Crocinitomicaceae bacterium]